MNSNFPQLSELFQFTADKQRLGPVALCYSGEGHKGQEWHNGQQVSNVTFGNPHTPVTFAFISISYCLLRENGQTGMASVVPADK